MSFLSLRIKIIALVAAIFFLVFAANTVLGMRSAKEQNLMAAEKRVEDLVDGYFDVLNTMMLTGTIATRGMYQQKLLAKEEIVGVRAIRSEALNQQYPGGAEDERPEDELDHRALAGERVIHLAEGPEGRMLSMVKPAIALDQIPGQVIVCTQCHLVPAGTVLGAMRVDFSLGATDARARQEILINNGISFGVVLSGVLLLFFALHHLIIRPISTMSVFVDGLSSGDLRESFGWRSNDELGVMSEKLDGFASNLNGELDSIRHKGRELLTFAADLRQAAERMSQQTRQAGKEVQGYTQFGHSVQTSASVITEAMQRVDGATQGVTASAEAVDREAHQTLTSMEEIRGFLEMLATASEEFSATISEISNHTEQTRSVSEGAVGHVSQAKKQVEHLQVTCFAIGDAVEMIEEIAEQTSTLAINAQIEAARAGDRGRGFSVVAQSVGDLAKQTNEVAQTIFPQVEEIRKAAGNTDQRVSAILATIKDIHSRLESIAAAVEEQTATAGENAQNISGIQGHLDHILHNTERVTAASQDIVASLNSLKADTSDTVHQAQMMETGTTALAGRTETLVQTMATTDDEVGAVSDRSRRLNQMAEEFMAFVDRFHLRS
jgi:methyl-accepting chemotaxis protein